MRFYREPFDASPFISPDPTESQPVIRDSKTAFEDLLNGVGSRAEPHETDYKPLLVI